jgi:RHS repeat-associated protein
MTTTKTYSPHSIQSPFGMVMPGRNWSAATATGYGFGFNGKLKDDDISGNGNIYDYGYRIYNPRIGRWFSVDAENSRLPSFSPYNFCINNPLIFKDNDGKVPLVIVDEQTKTITLYQPVFVITKGENAMDPSEIPQLQAEFDNYINQSTFTAQDMKSKEVYQVNIVFQFIEGGTVEEAESKIKELQKSTTSSVGATYTTISDDAAFESLYKSMGGDKDPKIVGGFTASKRNVFIKKSVATIREKVHEGFHLLLADDSEFAVGILEYTYEFGEGPGIKAENVKEVLNKNMNSYSNVYTTTSDGAIVKSEFKSRQFKVKADKKVKTKDE